MPDPRTSCGCCGPPAICPACVTLAGDCVYGWYCLDLKDSLGVEVPGYPRMIYWGPGVAGFIVGGTVCLGFLGTGTYTIRLRTLRGSVSIPPASCTDYTTNPCPVDQTFSVVVDCITRIVTPSTLTIVPPCYDFKISGGALGCFDYDSYGHIDEPIMVTVSGPGTITQVHGFEFPYNGFLFDVQVPTPVMFPISYTVTLSCTGFLDCSYTVTFTNCRDTGTNNPNSCYLTKIDFPVFVAGCCDNPILGGGRPPCPTNPLPGATVTLSGGMTGTCTTDATGHCSITLSTPYDGTSDIIATVSHPRYVTLVEHVNLVPGFTPCGLTTALNTPLPAYVCECCPEAMARTLTCTLGGFTITLTETNPGNYGSGYKGTTVVSVTSYQVNSIPSGPFPGGICTLGVGGTPSSIGATSTGPVCITVTFNCRGVLIAWNNSSVSIIDGHGGCGYPIQDSSCTAPPCLLSGGFSYDPSVYCHGPANVPGLLDCNPFMFTATSPLVWLPGPITITE